MRYEVHNNWKVDKFQEVKRTNSKGHNIKSYYAECLNCNTDYLIRYADVKNGSSKMCKSCSASVRNTKHGEAGKTRLYSIWLNMRDRCNNPNNPDYSIYGGSGVTVCKDWDDYLEFKKWSLSNGYSDNKVLDKDIGSDKLELKLKRYSPDTCSWISINENSSYANKEKELSNIEKFNISVKNRKISDNDICKIRKMLSIDLEYKDIVKVVETNFATISHIKDGSLMTISELRDKLKI